MKTIKLHVLCEGQTELRFASRVLATHLILKDILVLPQLLITSKRKNARGGMLSYQQVVRDLTVMMKSATDSETEAHIFTTMFDLYALPSDFPGYKATSTASGCVRVAAIEDAFAQAIDSRRFLPYIQLHEFEALVLCGLPELAQSYPNATRELTALQAELQRVYGEDMEAVDGGLETAPSKRISRRWWENISTIK